MRDRVLQNSVFSIPLDEERTLIYAPLHRTAFVGNPALESIVLERLENEGEIAGEETDFMKVLSGSGFFEVRQPPSDEYSSRGVRYDSVILFLTNQCNLRCLYCYAHSGEYPAKFMDWNTARAAIDFAWKDSIRHGVKEFTLGFHGGGEATLNRDVLVRSVEYAEALARQSGVKLQLSGAFNACWTDSMREFIAEHFTEISISLDGVPEIQNAQRPGNGDLASFDEVHRTLKRLDGSRVKYGIRMTVTEGSAYRLAESVEFICRNYTPVKIQAEPVFEQGRALDNAMAVSDLSVFVREFAKAYPIARRHGVELFYSGARPDLLTHRFCLAACRAFVVTTDGDVTTCFESYGREHPLSRYFLVGRFDGKSSFDLDREKLEGYFHHTVEENEHCRDCFCKWHCAGDCAIKTMRQDGDAGYQTTERCAVNREITKFLILDKIRESGGWIWLGDEAFSRLSPELKQGMGGSRCC